MAGAPDEGRGVRVQKFLSATGAASRREAEALMRAGRVRVNGHVVTTLGTRIHPGRDLVEVDGEPVRAPARRWVAFHKPAGCLTTRKDPRGRPTVYDRLPEEMGRLRYVGRLDRGTEGLLLLTNDGETAHRLLHPSSGVAREYRARVRGVPDRETLERLRRGVELEDGPARADRVDLLRRRGQEAELALVLREGRKREVRRLLAAVGHPVLRLKRVRFGPLELGDLPRGRWRDLDPREVEALQAAAPGGAGGATRGRR